MSIIDTHKIHIRMTRLYGSSWNLIVTLTNDEKYSLSYEKTH